MSHPPLEHPPLLHQPLILPIPPSSLPIKVPDSTLKLATAVPTLSRVVLDPSWLSQVYEGLFDSSNKEMAKLVALDRGINAMYGIWLAHRLGLVFRHLKPKVDQLFVPKVM